jgi:hypothetical protein
MPSKEKIIFGTELVLFLVPVTVVAIPGLGYMLIVVLGDITYKPISVFFYEVLTIISIGALVSTWIASIKYLKKGALLLYDGTPVLYVFICLGITLSVVSGLELITPSYIMELIGLKPGKTYIAIYSLGLPVCVPVLHLLYHSRLMNANKQLNSASGAGAPPPVS